MCVCVCTLHGPPLRGSACCGEVHPIITCFCLRHPQLPARFIIAVHRFACQLTTPVLGTNHCPAAQWHQRSCQRAPVCHGLAAVGCATHPPHTHRTQRCPQHTHRRHAPRTTHHAPARSAPAPSKGSHVAHDALSNGKGHGWCFLFFGGAVAPASRSAWSARCPVVPHTHTRSREHCAGGTSGVSASAAQGGTG